MNNLKNLFDACKVLWITFLAMMQISDFRQSVLLSIITLIVGIIMKRSGASGKAIATTCAIIELFVVLSALFVI